MTQKRETTEAQIIAWLRYSLSQRLGISFTDASANELRLRVAGGIKEEMGIDVDPDWINVVTFNAICMDAFKKYASELGYKKKLSVIDVDPTAEAEKIEPMITGDRILPGIPKAYAVPLEMDGGRKGAMGAMTLAKKAFAVIRDYEIDTLDSNAVLDFIDALTKEGLYNRMTDETVKALLGRYREYSDMLKAEGLITFSEQEIMGMHLIKNHPEYLASLGIKNVIVDEFQDSNNYNMDLVKCFFSQLIENGGSIESIMVVGDDAQSIYGFRRANPENMLKFDEKIGHEVTKFFMTKNYRSYAEVLAAPNELIKLNVNRIDKPLVAMRGEGGKYSLQAYEDDDKTYEEVAKIAKAKIEEGYEPSEICVIARNKKPLSKIASVLSKAEVPWVMKAPVKMIKNSRVHAAIKFADAWYDPEATQSYKEYLIALNNGSFAKVFSIEEQTAKIDEIAQQFMLMRRSTNPDYQRLQWHEFLEAIDIGEDEIYEQWLAMMYDRGNKAKAGEELAEELAFIRSFVKYGKGTEAKMDGDYKNVVLTTAHSSKGLEWPVGATCS